MSNVPMRDADNNIFRPDTFSRTENGNTVHMQSVVPVNPVTGDPLNLDTNNVIVTSPIPPGSNVIGVTKAVDVLVMESGSNQIIPNITFYGWVSGNLANLQPSTQVDIIFDLGPLWNQYNLLQLSFHITQSIGINHVHISGNDIQSFNTKRRLCVLSDSNFPEIYDDLTISTGTKSAYFKPMGRFVIIRATNSDTVNSLGVDSGIVLVGYPN